MIEVGMEIKTPGFLLKVEDARGTWVRFLYWDSYSKSWKQRSCTEKRAKVEQKIAAGEWNVQ